MAASPRRLPLLGLRRDDPLREPDGTLRGFAKILRDNTERKQAEAERERLLAETRDSRSDAEAANQAKSGFMATMTHELRTPLNAVIAYADLLEMGIPAPVPAAALAHVERIRLSGKHLTHLIEEMRR